MKTKPKGPPKSKPFNFKLDVDVAADIRKAAKDADRPVCREINGRLRRDLAANEKL